MPFMIEIEDITPSGVLVFNLFIFQQTPKNYKWS